MKIENPRVEKAETTKRKGTKERRKKRRILYNMVFSMFSKKMTKTKDAYKLEDKKTGDKKQLCLEGIL